MGTLDDLFAVRIALYALALVACLAVRHRLCSAASGARYFGRAKATLSEQMAACRKRRADQQLIATPVEVILAEVAAMRRRER